MSNGSVVIAKIMKAIPIVASLRPIPNPRKNPGSEIDITNGPNGISIYGGPPAIDWTSISAIIIGAR